MSMTLRSSHLVRAVSAGAGVIVLAGVISATALANLQYPPDDVFRSAVAKTPGAPQMEPVQITAIDQTAAWRPAAPVRLATDMPELSYSPNGLRHLTGPPPMTPTTASSHLRDGRGNRLLLWSGFSAAAAVGALRQSQAAWGASNGKFHIKSDLRGDGLAMTDEASHLLIAYRLSQLIESGYRWSGIKPERARLWGSAEAWLLTFLVEYPIDAYNPQQGFGVSDLLFNTLGALAAYGHSAAGNPRWDIKVSVKRRFFDGSGRVIAYNTKQYDDFIYWITYRPLRGRYIPLLIGLGYSTSHGMGRGPSKELRLGAGTSLEEIGAMIGPRTERFLRPLNFIFFNLAAKITWR
jgi:hypothetical protein